MKNYILGFLVLVLAGMAMGQGQPTTSINRYGYPMSFTIPAKGRDAGRQLYDGDTITIFKAPYNCYVSQFEFCQTDSTPNADTSTTKYYEFNLLKQNGTTKTNLGMSNTSRKTNANYAHVWKIFAKTRYDSLMARKALLAAAFVHKDSLVRFEINDSTAGDSIAYGFNIRWIVHPVISR